MRIATAILGVQTLLVLIAVFIVPIATHGTTAGSALIQLISPTNLLGICLTTAVLCYLSTHGSRWGFLRTTSTSVAAFIAWLFPTAILGVIIAGFSRETLTLSSSLSAQVATSLNAGGILIMCACITYLVLRAGQSQATRMTMPGG